MGDRGRPVLIGVALGLLLVAALLGYAYFTVLDGRSSASDQLVVIALAQDTDGAEVAGVIGLTDASMSPETLEMVDPTTVLEASPTSYDMIKDQYPFGGGDAVAESIAELESTEQLPWVALPYSTWTAIIDEAGGLEYRVDEPVNAYVDGELYLIPAGEQRLTGAEVHALLAWQLLESSQEQDVDFGELGEVVVRTLLDRWEDVIMSVETGAAESSVPAETLQEWP